MTLVQCSALSLPLVAPLLLSGKLALAKASRLGGWSSSRFSAAPTTTLSSKLVARTTSWLPLLPSGSALTARPSLPSLPGMLWAVGPGLAPRASLTPRPPAPTASPNTRPRPSTGWLSPRPSASQLLPSSHFHWLQTCSCRPSATCTTPPTLGMSASTIREARFSTSYTGRPACLVMSIGRPWCGIRTVPELAGAARSYMALLVPFGAVLCHFEAQNNR